MTNKYAREWPQASGEMASRIRDFDWSQTSLGSIENWTERCHSVVEMGLANGFPTVVLVGADLIQIYNDGYRLVMGAKHPAGLGQPTRDCWPEVWHINGPIYERVWAGETVTFEDALFPITRHGRIENAWFTISYSPLKNRNGVSSDILVTLFETTGRVLAQTALNASEKRFRGFVNATSDVIYRMNADWSEMQQLDGRSFLSDTTEPNATWIEAYIPPVDRTIVQDAIDKALRTNTMFDLEHRVHRVDGSLGWTRSRAVPIVDETGLIVEWLGAAKDITEQHQVQETLRMSEAQLQVLVAELHHRTRNLIGIIGTIMRQILASSTSLSDFRTRFTDRLAALSRVQGLFSSKVDEQITIADIVRLELDALGADLTSDRIRIEGENVSIRKSTVQILSLAIHELATNAKKYGALVGDDGVLMVKWNVYTADDKTSRLHFEWTETGIDPDVEETEGPMHKGGYGRELIEKALPYSLKAQTTYNLGVDRLYCTVDMPIDR